MDYQETDLVDKEALSSLKEALRERYDKIEKLFCEQTPKKIEELKTFVQEKKSEEARHTAHSLKGSSANFAVPGLAAIFKQIEDLCRENKFDDVENLIFNAKQQFEIAKKIIQEQP